MPVLVENLDETSATSTRMWAGLCLGTQDFNQLAVALPGSAAELLPTSLSQTVEEASGLGMVEVCFARVPVHAVTAYAEGSYSPEQIEAFWIDPAHVPFGYDPAGEIVWPAWESVAYAAPDG